MDISLTARRFKDVDGVSQTLSLEQEEVGEHLSDVLRVFLEFLVAMGFSYVEVLKAVKRSGGYVSSDDLGYSDDWGVE